MMNIPLVPVEEFRRVRQSALEPHQRLALIADMCRANALSAVKRAGSGHLGSSFSAMDIVVWLYHEQMNTLQAGFDSPDRDIYFSSKGHDVPGLYAVLFALGVLSEERFLQLRRLGGLHGHPDISIPGIEANSGSLGMGISKGRGMAWAKRKLGRSGRVIVMTGDGELQEGQNYEALQAAVQQQIGNLIVIVDHNKVQSDKRVCEIMDLAELEQKFRCFGWHTTRCSGHNFAQLERVFEELGCVTDRPKVLIADTLKGCGVSFMEHPSALRAGNGLYPWHAGAPNDQDFSAAHAELVDRINTGLLHGGLAPLALKSIASEDKLPTVTLTVQNALGEPVSQAMKKPALPGVTGEYVAEAFGQTLIEIAARRPDLIVLDADLASDCRVREFEKRYPDRFIENGIAEQDMVSMAGGLARQGLLPVVNSFVSFLAARANEQIYNNASEGTKIIYACHYAGLIPAGPGKSHQSLRDISLFGALPNCVVIQPCNALETRMVLNYCVNQPPKTLIIRMNIGPSPRMIELPEGYALTEGRGVILKHGRDALLFAYGPVMLHEALAAGELLAEKSFDLCVVNMPWLNQHDPKWLTEIIHPFQWIYVLEDHAPVGGLGDYILNALMNAELLHGRRVKKFAVEGYPACGTPSEALNFHGLNGASLANRILLNQQRSL